MWFTAPWEQKNSDKSPIQRMVGSSFRTPSKAWLNRHLQSLIPKATALCAHIYSSIVKDEEAFPSYIIMFIRQAVADLKTWPQHNDEGEHTSKSSKNTTKMANDRDSGRT